MAENPFPAECGGEGAGGRRARACGSAREDEVGIAGAGPAGRTAAALAAPRVRAARLAVLLLPARPRLRPSSGTALLTG